ncbi:MAG: GspH/FimT family pseudopilin [Sphingomonadales bacterium]
MPTSAAGSRSAGFTLIELMVVLVIIGLASAAVVLAIPDPRGQVTDEAERFAARALAVRDDAIVQGRAMSIRIDGQGSAVERRIRGRWEPAGDRAFRPVAWVSGTGIVAPNSRVTFDSTGTVADPMTVELSRGGMTARVEIPGEGVVHVVR